MKKPLPALLACLLVLSGCATLDQNDRMALARHNASPALTARMAHGEPLAVPDIIELSKKGLPSLFIIRYLRSTETAYPLTVDDVSQLKNAGVSSDVINYLLSTPSIYSPRPYLNPYPPPFPYDSYYYTDPFGPRYRMHHW